LTAKKSKPKEELSRLNNKVKVKLLEHDKRFADLELGVGKLEDKFEDVWKTIPNIDARSEHIEDLLNIINLGLINFKEKSKKLETRVSELEKVPAKMEQELKGYSDKMRELGQGLSKFSAKVQALNTVKDDIAKNIREDVLPDINILKSSIEKNNVSVEQMKNEVNNFKSMIKSFQQTLQLLDINSVIQQFDNFNVRLANAQAEIDTLKDSIPSKELYDNDIEIMRNKIQDFSSTIIDSNTKLKEFDSRLQVITDKINKANIVGKFNEIRKETKELEKAIYSNENKIEDLEKNLQERDEVFESKLTNIEKLTKKAEHLGFLESIREEVQGHAENLEETKDEIEKLANKTEKIYYNMNKKISDFGTVEKEIDKLKIKLEDSEKMSGENTNVLKNNIDLLNKMKKEVKELKEIKKMKFDKGEIQPLKDIVYKLVEKTYELSKKTAELDTLEERLKNTEIDSKKFETITSLISNLKDELKDIEKEKEPMKKVLKKLVEKNSELENKISSLNKQIEKGDKKQKIDKSVIKEFKNIYNEIDNIKKSGKTVKSGKEIPKDVMNEIMSLKELTARLQTENNDMKQTIEKLKNISRPEEKIPPHLVAGMAEKLKVMETRVNALESEIRREMSIKPVILE